MTPQEQQMLDGLIERVRNTQLPAKDPDADRRIQETLGRDPNALYILSQSVLVQGYALEQAQKQLAELKQQTTVQQQTQHEPTFLEKIFGRGDPEPAQRPTPQPGSGYGTPVYGGQQTQPPYGQPAYGQPGYAQPPQAYYPPPQGYPAYPQQPGYGGGFGGGGFLQGALQTAAGVAMGEIAFQSIEGLFRGFGHAAGYGSDRAMGFGDVGGGNSGDYGQGDGFFSREQAENGVNDQLSADIEDRRGESGSESRGFLGDSGGGTEDDLSGNGDSVTDNGYDSDNSAPDDSGSDFSDSGSFDDGGSFDSGGSFGDDN